MGVDPSFDVFRVEPDQSADFPERKAVLLSENIDLT